MALLRELLNSSRIGENINTYNANTQQGSGQQEENLGDGGTGGGTGGVPVPGASVN